MISYVHAAHRDSCALGQVSHSCWTVAYACALNSLLHVWLIAGRRPYTTGLGLDNVGIKPNKRGQIEVDDHFRTSVPNIYAIGDVIPGKLWVHELLWLLCT